MSLLQNAFTMCSIMNRTAVEDGEGGDKTEWILGRKFMCAIVLDMQSENKIAMQQGVKAVYTLTTDRSTTLHYHDVIKRLSDGKIFRVTSNGDDNCTPPTATLNMRQVTAEEWELP